jgi:DNA-binding response OmpR family regulator
MTTVLLVEDNLTLIESIAFELEMRDYTVLQATDGKEALALLQKGDVLPDIVVSDIAMPDMDGYELLEAVRANHDWELIPFIFLTAFDSPNAQRIGKDLGVDDYLTKPFEPDELVSAMENKIKRTRQIEAHAARDLDKTRHELLTMISHELRTPLTSIFGSSELLKNSLVDVPDTMTQDLLTLLQSGVRRMNRLVNRILFMVQIESGYIKAQLDALNEIVDLNRTIDDVIKQYNEGSVAPVNIDFKPYPQALSMETQETYLAVLVDEILDNAVRYSNVGQKIIIRTERTDDEHARFILEDTGSGIDANLLQSLQTYLEKGAPMPDYIGLGLAIDTRHR